jgi:hypothetical protein
MPDHVEANPNSIHVCENSAVRAEAFRLLTFPIPESEQASVTVLCVPNRGFVFVQRIEGGEVLFVRGVEGSRGMTDALPLLVEYARSLGCSCIETVAMSETRRVLFVSRGFKPSLTKPGTLFLNIGA